MESTWMIEEVGDDAKPVSVTVHVPRVTITGADGAEVSMNPQQAEDLGYRLTEITEALADS